MHIPTTTESRQMGTRIIASQQEIERTYTRLLTLCAQAEAERLLLIMQRGTDEDAVELRHRMKSLREEMDDVLIAGRVFSWVSRLLTDKEHQ